MALGLARSFVCRACRSGYQPRRALATAASTAQTSQSRDSRVRLMEVGPRDGLQNEAKLVPLSTKIELIERLARTGLSSVEAGAFVSPKWVPQMSNSSEILQHILQKKIASPRQVTYSFLAPNMKGFESAAAILRENPKSYVTDAEPATILEHQPPAPALEVAVFAAATESFSQKNLNCSVAESLVRFREVIRAAKAMDLRVRAYVSVVLGCPFEGHDVDPHRVAAVATDLLEAGADEISLGDTTGMGTAPRTKALLSCLESAGVRSEDVAMHFHDTYGQALVNTAVALEHGIRSFDSSVAGLGGCPYSPGATGNVATEDVVYFLETLGMDTGVDLDAVADIGAWISAELGRENASNVGKAVIGARLRAAESK